MSRAAGLLALLIAAQCVAGDDDDSDVRVLTDSNFEHDTQAAGGATTGAWFVLFYAPWCGWCKRIMPDWEQLATDVKQELTIAKVDATSSLLTSSRFDVQAFPTLILFADNKMYKYEGQRSYEDLLKFALGGYKDAAWNPVPPEKFFILQYAELFGKELARAVEEDPNTMLLTVTLSTVGGLLVAWLLIACMGTKAPQAQPEGDQKKED
eukprot:TRINITY_DN37793_c0_g1_i1.p1 TRINITY_DN37793_c0_g1~~TRINITY_DN37793_c0_g1_i1.p1  ORF type:complete len:209 (+),score=61.09 TRINITY_DN37793_c0_g1_i1:40-666(+)